MFYLEQLPDELLTIENNPNIELKKDTRLTPKDREIKIWLWVAYGMIAVKNVYKHGPITGAHARTAETNDINVC